MATFEYHILPSSEEFLMKNRGGDAKDNLNVLGRDGWDIAAALDGAEPGTYVLILRRASN
jgi:hypothetical protein